MSNGYEAMVSSDEYRAARGYVEGMGVPTTARLMALATRVVTGVRKRREIDALLDGSQLAREVSQQVVADIEIREYVNICSENDRLRAVRIPTNPDMPTNPSVGDLSEYVLLFYALKVARAEVVNVDG